jgi:5,5'-dehydrodivanillate O-demethylase
MARVLGLATPETDFYFRPVVKYEFAYCEWGIDKRCVYGGERPEEEIRPPLIFPNILRIPAAGDETLHWRVPIDDENTRIFILWFTPHRGDGPAPVQESVPVVQLPSDRDERGEHIVNTILQQDRMAWETQGAIFDRTAEHLGASDEGIVMFRKLLDEQIAVVERGGEPMALVRDPGQNRLIAFESSYNSLEPIA